VHKNWGIDLKSRALSIPHTLNSCKIRFAGFRKNAEEEKEEKEEEEEEETKTSTFRGP